MKCVSIDFFASYTGLSIDLLVNSRKRMIVKITNYIKWINKCMQMHDCFVVILFRSVIVEI